MMLRPVIGLGVCLLLSLTACTTTSYRNEAGQVTSPTRVDTYSVRVGDCLGKVETDATSQLELIPCASEHYWQAFAEQDLTGADHPGNSALSDQARKVCEAAFANLPGLDSESSGKELRFLAPTRSSWKQGDRRVTCLTGRSNGGLTGSILG